MQDNGGGAEVTEAESSLLLLLEAQSAMAASRMTAMKNLKGPGKSLSQKFDKTSNTRMGELGACPGGCDNWGAR